MRFINLILSDLIGQFKLGIVEMVVIIYLIRMDQSDCTIRGSLFHLLTYRAHL